MVDSKKLAEIASQIRRDVVRMVNGVSSGHPGGSLGCADLFTALFFHEMNHNSSFSMNGKEEDVFILSNGHISPVYYSALARSGYFKVKELETFRKINSRLQGHPATEEHLPGIRIATGSLGQGLSVAIGVAISKKLNSDDNLVYCLTGDGELQEGQNWEAFLFAAHHKIDNLIAIVDYNGLQIDGANDQVISLGNLRQKLVYFNWEVLEMNGNDIENILEVIGQAKQKAKNGIPIVILMKTIMGKGVDYMEGDHHWHGVAPNDEQLETALAQLQETLGDY